MADLSTPIAGCSYCTATTGGRLGCPHHGAKGGYYAGSQQMQSGWICPRCRKVHSPYVLTCDCQPPANYVGAQLGGFTTQHFGARAADKRYATMAEPVWEAMTTYRKLLDRYWRWTDKQRASQEAARG